MIELHQGDNGFQQNVNDRTVIELTAMFTNMAKRQRDKRTYVLVARQQPFQFFADYESDYHRECIEDNGRNCEV